MLFSYAYAGTRVFLTGDSGFKGAWLGYWLQQLGAKIWGYALPPEHAEDAFAAGALPELVTHTDGDVRDLSGLQKALDQAQPQIIFHLAAQSLVRRSYADPLATLGSNVLGTANVLEAVRLRGQPCAVLVITSDKCYENPGRGHLFQEQDPMGGHDVYSASKGCAELVCAAYRRSFFHDPALGIWLATARAGNVIGPGDWAEDRLLPDAARAARAKRPLRIRNPQAVRPWQHVLECLSGYLWLGSRLLSGAAAAFGEAWNFGPHADDQCAVAQVVDLFFKTMGQGTWVAETEAAPHEAPRLQLSHAKATRLLGWQPVWNLASAVARTARGYQAWDAHNKARIRQVMGAEITAYVQDAVGQGQAWTK